MDAEKNAWSAPQYRSEMRRFLLAISACVLFALTGCSKPHNRSPYWARADRLFLEFLDTPKDTEKSLENLKRIRRDMAVLDHPDWANGYHDLLVEYMQDRISSLQMELLFDQAMKTYLDPSVLSTVRERALAAADDLRKKQTTQIKEDGEKARKKLDILTAERQQLGGPEWPLTVLRRTPVKG